MQHFLIAIYKVGYISYRCFLWIMEGEGERKGDGEGAGEGEGEGEG